jgi:8-oxo-dGTP diphosphatase
LKGWWSLPGGGVEIGELLETAVRREVREETGLEVEVICLLEVFERIMHDDAGAAQYHYVLMDYLCRPAGGELCAADDASRVAWVTEAQLRDLRITEGTPAVIAKAFTRIKEYKEETPGNG